MNLMLGYGQVRLEPACALSIEKYGVTGLPGSEFVWNIVGGTIISGEGTDTVTVRWDEINEQAGVEGRLEVVEYTISGCFDVASIATIHIRGPVIDTRLFKAEACFGDTVEFDAGSNYLEPYAIEWLDKSHSQTFYASTSQKIKLTITDSAGCVDADSISFVIHNLPLVNLGKDTILCNYDNPLMIYYSQVMDNPSSFSRADWYFAGEVTHNDYISVDPVEFVDTLSVEITDIHECKQRDTMLIMPCDVNKLFLNIPNTIMPNVTDGTNVKWNIPHIDMFPNAVLEIFDRWGRLVYHTEHVFEEPWEGKSAGKLLPMDSYYFVLNLNFGDAKPIVGTVNLIK